jgi:hypothetical protein
MADLGGPTWVTYPSHVGSNGNLSTTAKRFASQCRGNTPLRCHGNIPLCVGQMRHPTHSSVQSGLASQFGAVHSGHDSIAEVGQAHHKQ